MNPTPEKKWRVNLNSRSKLTFVLFFNQITSSSNNHVHWSWESTFNYNNTITFLLCVIPFLPPSSLLDLINLKFQKEVDSVFYRHLITIKVAWCCFIGVCLGIWSWVNLPFFSSLSSALSWCFPVTSQWLHWHHSCSQMHGHRSYISSTSFFHLPTAWTD